MVPRLIKVAELEFRVHTWNIVSWKLTHQRNRAIASHLGHAGLDNRPGTQGGKRESGCYTGQNVSVQDAVKADPGFDSVLNAMAGRADLVLALEVLCRHPRSLVVGVARL